MNVDICVATKNSVNTLPKLLQSVNAQLKQIIQDLLSQMDHHPIGQLNI